MKSCYVLIEETNLRKPVGREKLVERNIRVFENFEKAKEKMKLLIKEFATTDNGLFDGNGGIVGLKEYFDELLCTGSCCNEEIEFFSKASDILKLYFLDEKMIYEDKFFLEDKVYGFEISEFQNGWVNQNTLEDINPNEYIIPFRLNHLYKPFMIQSNAIYMNDAEKNYVCRVYGECDQFEQPRFFNLELHKQDIE